MGICGHYANPGPARQEQKLRDGFRRPQPGTDTGLHSWLDETEREPLMLASAHKELRGSLCSRKRCEPRTSRAPVERSSCTWFRVLRLEAKMHLVDDAGLSGDEVTEGVGGVVAAFAVFVGMGF